MNSRRFSIFSTSARAYIELLRPANIITAFADILAGFAAAGTMISIGAPLSSTALVWLLFSTSGLYGGGVVLNDVFDAKLDAKERPERAIPSGRVSKFGAGLLGILLLAAGMIAAYQINIWSFVLAAVIAFCIVIYNSWAKHSMIFGPFFMGLCRGGNLLLGCSIVPVAIIHYGYLALIPVIYIASITLISRGEVHGGKKMWGFIAVGLILVVTCSLFGLGFLSVYSVLRAGPFVALFVIMVIPAFIKSARDPSADLIKKAVKRGVLMQIVLDSAIAAGFGGIWLGVITLCLLPVSILLGRFFSVS